MRKYAPSEQTLQWQTLTPQHMPPIGEDFLLWRACNESDGGLPTLARRWKREGENPPIVYQVGTGQEWKRVLPEDEYKTCRWAAISPPPVRGDKADQNHPAANGNGRTMAKGGIGT